LLSKKGKFEMTEKNRNFVTGAFIIAIAHMLVKAIGAIYKIPLDRFILHTEGMGIYNSAYTIYNWLFVVSTAGIPVAISKMIAEAKAMGNYNEAKKIFRVSKLLLFFVGIAAAGIMFFFAKGFSNIIKAESAYLTMMVMAPSLFFVAMASAYRGFYQGQQNMMPTAISEVIEAMSKLVFGLSIAYVLDHTFKISSVSSAGAISGITIGTAISFIYLLIYNIINIKKFPKNSSETKTSSGGRILKTLIKISIPITIGVSVFTLTSVIDMAMVMNQLSNLGYSLTERLSMFGYLGRAITLFNLPPTVISAIAISIVPTIAAALALKDKNTANRNAKSAIRITILFSTPAAVGLSAIAAPILQLLYKDYSFAFLLNVMGLAVIFVSLVQVCNAILQSWGKVWIPVRNMFIGGVVKVIVNLLLVSQASININGAPIGTLLCYFTVMALNFYEIKKLTGIKFEFVDFIFKPAITAVVTAFFAIVTYKYVSSYFGNLIGVATSMGLAGVTYFISLLLIKGLKREDILLLPKGEKIATLLEKFKLL
jgi:stage V sporulation protein B